MIEFNVEGLISGVREQVAKIGDSLGESALRQIGFAGAEIFREEAKRNAAAHVKTGTLYRSIIAKRVEEESDGGTKQVYIVTVREGKFNGNDAFYWRFVEQGHKFVPRNRKVSAKTGRTIGWKAHRAKADFAADARRLEFGTAGAPAYPFMRPAYESKKGEAAAVMQAKLNEIIKKALG